MIKISSTVSARADLLATEIGGELIMMDMDSGRYFNLNIVGSVIWRELKQPRKVEDLCQFLAERYEAPAGEIERDVLDLLRQMDDSNMVHVHT